MKNSSTWGERLENAKQYGVFSKQDKELAEDWFKGPVGELLNFERNYDTLDHKELNHIIRDGRDYQWSGELELWHIHNSFVDMVDGQDVEGAVAIYEYAAKYIGQKYPDGVIPGMRAAAGRFILNH